MADKQKRYQIEITIQEMTVDDDGNVLEYGDDYTQITSTVFSSEEDADSMADKLMAVADVSAELLPQKETTAILTRDCAWCDEDFIPKEEGQRCCSPECEKVMNWTV